MAKDKKREHASEAVWDGVRRDRRARRKLTSKADLQQSAALLRAHAEALDALAASAPELDAAPVAPAENTPDAKKKRKRSSGAAKKSKKASD